MKDLLVIVTTRGRPDSLTRLAQAWAATVTRNPTMLVVTDDDDPARYPVVDIPGAEVIYEVGPRRGHVGSLNHAALAHLDEYRIIGQQGDDHVPLTVGWDDQIIRALASPGMVYGNDLFQKANLPTSVYFSREVLAATGRFAPEGLWHLYADNYWLNLGAHSGCIRFLPGCVIEHRHPLAKKAEFDLTYHESINNDIDRADKEVWDQFLADGLLMADAEKVRAAIGGLSPVTGIIPS